MNKVEILNHIDELVNKDLDSACKIYNEMCSDLNSKDYEVSINYLKNVIKEKNLLLDLEDEKRKIYEDCIRLGRYAYNNKNYELATDYYMRGKYVTNHPIFDYYIGKMLYKNNCFEEAYDYFLRYENVGGEKLLKTLLYLWKLDNYYDRKNIANNRLNKSSKLVLVFSKNKDWRIKKRSNKYYGYFDKVKYNAYKKVNMEENDFYTEDIDINIYDSYSFSEKLEVIKWLYKNNYIKKADMLLNELEKESTSSLQRRKINQERKLKILYKNQAKNK